MSTRSDRDDRLAGIVPGYVHDHDSPAGLFTRLQRVVIFLEMLQEEAVASSSISYRDFVILATLRKEPEPHELAVSQIAAYVLRPMGSISQALDRVEQRGLVERRAASSDRRKVIVSLTPMGRRFADEVMHSYDEIRERIFSRLTDEQFARLDDTVQVLLDALEADHWESEQ